MKKIITLIILLLVSLFTKNDALAMEVHNLTGVTAETYQAQAYTTTRIESDGYLYVTGYGAALGLGSTAHVHTWTKTSFHQPIDWEFSYNSGVIDKTGVLWVSGLNTYDSLGLGHSDAITDFQNPIGLASAYSAGYKCVKYETGSQVSLVLMEDNNKNQKIFVAGDGTNSIYVEATGYEGYIIDIEASLGSVALNEEGDIFHLHGSTEFQRISAYDGKVKQIDADTFITGVLLSTIDGLYKISETQAITYLATNSQSNVDDIIMARIGVNFHGYITTDNILYYYTNSSRSWTIIPDVTYFDIGRDHYIYYKNNNMYYNGTSSSDSVGQYGDGTTNNSGSQAVFSHTLYFDLESWIDEFVSSAEPLRLPAPILRSYNTREITNTVEFTDYVILDFTGIDLLSGVTMTISSGSYSKTVTITTSNLSNNLYLTSSSYGKEVGEYKIELKYKDYDANTVELFFEIVDKNISIEADDVLLDYLSSVQQINNDVLDTRIKTYILNNRYYNFNHEQLKYVNSTNTTLYNSSLSSNDITITFYKNNQITEVFELGTYEVKIVFDIDRYVTNELTLELNVVEGYLLSNDDIYVSQNDVISNNLLFSLDTYNIKISDESYFNSDLFTITVTINDTLSFNYYEEVDLPLLPGDYSVVISIFKRNDYTNYPLLYNSYTIRELTQNDLNYNENYNNNIDNLVIELESYKIDNDIYNNIYDCVTSNLDLIGNIIEVEEVLYLTDININHVYIEIFYDDLLIDSILTSGEYTLKITLRKLIGYESFVIGETDFNIEYLYSNIDESNIGITYEEELLDTIYFADRNAAKYNLVILSNVITDMNYSTNIRINSNNGFYSEFLFDIDNFSYLPKEIGVYNIEIEITNEVHNYKIDLIYKEITILNNEISFEYNEIIQLNYISSYNNLNVYNEVYNIINSELQNSISTTTNIYTVINNEFVLVEHIITFEIFNEEYINTSNVTVGNYKVIFNLESQYSNYNINELEIEFFSKQRENLENDILMFDNNSNEISFGVDYHVIVNNDTFISEEYLIKFILNDQEINIYEFNSKSPNIYNFEIHLINLNNIVEFNTSISYSTLIITKADVDFVENDNINSLLDGIYIDSDRTDYIINILNNQLELNNDVYTLIDNEYVLTYPEFTFDIYYNNEISKVDKVGFYYIIIKFEGSEYYNATTYNFDIEFQTKEVINLDNKFYFDNYTDTIEYYNNSIEYNFYLDVDTTKYDVLVSITNDSYNYEFMYGDTIEFINMPKQVGVYDVNLNITYLDNHSYTITSSSSLYINKANIKLNDYVEYSDDYVYESIINYYLDKINANIYSIVNNEFVLSDIKDIINIKIYNTNNDLIEVIEEDNYKIIITIDADNYNEINLQYNFSTIKTVNSFNYNILYLLIFILIILILLFIINKKKKIFLSIKN